MQASEYPEHGCYINILNKIQNIFEYALSQTSQILLIRFDVRYSTEVQYTDIVSNSLFQGFIENYKRYLSRQDFRPLHLWCTEMGNEGRLHHHVFFILDANEIRRMPMLSKATELWNRALGMPLTSPGLIHRVLPFQNTILGQRRSIIHRNDVEALQEAIYWCSYLAKIRGKTSLPSGSRSFGCSQFKP